MYEPKPVYGARGMKNKSKNTWFKKYHEIYNNHFAFFINHHGRVIHQGMPKWCVRAIDCQSPRLLYRQNVSNMFSHVKGGRPALLLPCRCQFHTHCTQRSSLRHTIAVPTFQWRPNDIATHSIVDDVQTDVFCHSTRNFFIFSKVAPMASGGTNNDSRDPSFSVACESSCSVVYPTAKQTIGLTFVAKITVFFVIHVCCVEPSGMHKMPWLPVAGGNEHRILFL